MNTVTKEIIISFIKTFISGFLTSLVLALSLLPEGTLVNPEFYKTGGAIALLTAVIRSALSETWKRSLPKSIGGK